MLLGMSGGELLTAPERMKWVGHSRNDAESSFLGVMLGVSGSESKAQCCK